MGNLAECSRGAEESVCSVCNPKIKGGGVSGTDCPPDGTGRNAECCPAAETGCGESNGGNPGPDDGVFRTVGRYVKAGRIVGSASFPAEFLLDIVNGFFFRFVVWCI